MTVEAQGNKRSWTGDGQTTVYAYPYPFLEKRDIEVYLDDVKLSEGFTVQTLPDYSAGANVTFDVAPDDGVSIVIRRSISITQEVSYPENGEFPAKSHEKALDKITLIALDAGNSLIKVAPSTSEDFNLYLPLPVPKKGLMINEDGTGFTLTDDDINTIISDPGFQVTSQDLLDENSKIKTLANDLQLGEESAIRQANANKDNIDTVAEDLRQEDSSVKAVGSHIDEVINVAEDLALGDDSEIVKVNNNEENINTVATNIDDVISTGDNIQDVKTVAGKIDDVTDVADNITFIITNADNIVDIQNASANAQTAIDNAVIAKQYAIGLPSEPEGHSAKYWRDTALGEIADASVEALDGIEENRKNAISSIQHEKNTSIQAVDAAKNVAIQVIGADVIAAQQSAESARESAAKAIGWDIDYVDEDTLIFKDKTQGEIDQNINYIVIAKNAALEAIEQAKNNILDIMDSYLIAANNAMTRAEAAQVAAEVARDSATNSKNECLLAVQSTGADVIESQEQVSLATAQADLASQKAQQAENAVIAANNYATLANQAAAQVFGYSQQAYQEAERAKEYAERAQFGWDIQFTDSTLLFTKLLSEV